ncbi:hypothetical protein QR680_011914 [Steinernema hermaphroditum]|uniref:Uncharacterized protein n=1 Tax=Steinernema hermaphroditum TaxID=289476 RepID=A0AA39I2I7_9BILA|nr:hypothetical protein QR680_011914 [Steinernema hermaphroditum]
MIAIMLANLLVGANAESKEDTQQLMDTSGPQDRSKELVNGEAKQEEAVIVSKKSTQAEKNALVGKRVALGQTLAELAKDAVKFEETLLSKAVVPGGQQRAQIRYATLNRKSKALLAEVKKLNVSLHPVEAKLSTARQMVRNANELYPWDEFSLEMFEGDLNDCLGRIEDLLTEEAVQTQDAPMLLGAGGSQEFETRSGGTNSDASTPRSRKRHAPRPSASNPQIRKRRSRRQGDGEGRRDTQISESHVRLSDEEVLTRIENLRDEIRDQTRSITQIRAHRKREQDNARLTQRQIVGPKGRVVKCDFCGGSHYNSACPVDVDYEERLCTAVDRGLCSKCLRPRHAGAPCTLTGHCRVCNSNAHHSAMCDVLVHKILDFEKLKVEMTLLQQERDRRRL